MKKKLYAYYVECETHSGQTHYFGILVKGITQYQTRYKLVYEPIIHGNTIIANLNYDDFWYEKESRPFKYRPGHKPMKAKTYDEFLNIELEDYRKNLQEIVDKNYTEEEATAKALRESYKKITVKYARVNSKRCPLVFDKREIDGFLKKHISKNFIAIPFVRVAVNDL